MSVRALYIDEHTGIAAGHRPGRRPGPSCTTPCTSRARRSPARAAAGHVAHLGGAAGAERGVLRGVLQRLRRRLLAALEPLTEVHLRLRAGGQRPRRRLPHQGRRAPGSTCAGSCSAARGVHELDLALDLRPFEDGGWYWFDLTTDDDELTLHAGRLVRGRGGARRGRGDHRDADVQPARRLRRHAHRDRRGPAGARRGDRGDPARTRAPARCATSPASPPRRPRSATGCGSSTSPTSAAPAATPGSCTRRSRTPDCEQILFMDDDILLEPDSVLRAVAFSRFAREPMLVGGQMLSLQARSQLSTMGEVVDRQHVPVAQRAAAPSRTTTSPSAPCARPRGCTGGSTSTTTPGGCA